MNGKNLLWFAVVFVATFSAANYVEKYFANRQIVVTPPVVVVPPPSPPVTPEPTILTLEKSLELITAAELKEWLFYLASPELEGRMSGKKGYFTAATFVEKKCQEYGLKTMRHRFDISRQNPGPHNETGENWTENVYAFIEGTDPALKDEIVVIGAHLDHIGYGPSMARDNKIAVHPGADDNGSGSVALLAAAKAFSRLGPQPRTVVFQWYSAEEMGLIGSRYYCNNPVFPKSGPDIKKHIAMINSDMIGRLGRGFYSVGWHTGDSSIDLKRMVEELSGKYPFNRSITSHGSGGSDHANFYNKRVPVAFLHTGLHDDYHRVGDTPDKINYEGMEKIARYTVELGHKIVHANMRPQFNHASFKPMSTTHDHGHSLFHSHGHTHDPKGGNE